MILSVVALGSAAASAVLKLLADAFELYSRTSDVADKPKAKETLLNVKAFMNLFAAGAVAYAAICQFGGPDWVGGGLAIVFGFLFVLTGGIWVWVHKS